MDVFSIIKKAKINKLQKPLALFAVALFALLFSSLTFAGAASTPDSTTLFYLPSASSILNPNTSVHVLYQLFGPLIDSVLGASSTSDPSEFLFALMLMHWNYILITGCAMFFIYHLVLGVFKSAEHGMFMGRDGDKSNTIFRVVLGPFIMVPAIKGGFCAAQYAIMTLILCGVHLANYVWSMTTQDIRMGATPTLPNGITSTLNNVAAELYEYSELDSILSSGDMNIGTSGITSPSSKIVLLQNYPAFESVAHALMTSGAYLQKGKDADSSSYQTGEWVLSGVKFYNSFDSTGIAISNGMGFESIVLSGAGVPTANPRYFTSGSVVPSDKHGENNREKALIAPLGFDLMSVPQDWVPPVLSSSNSPLYYDLGNVGEAYKHLSNNLPVWRSFPSYDPGGYDCRKLVGSSQAQSYQLTTIKQAVAGNPQSPTHTQMYERSVTFDDPDQEYKACLVYQTAYRLAHANEGAKSLPISIDEENPPYWKPGKASSKITDEAYVFARDTGGDTWQTEGIKVDNMIKVLHPDWTDLDTTCEQVKVFTGNLACISLQRRPYNQQPYKKDPLINGGAYYQQPAYSSDSGIPDPTAHGGDTMRLTDPFYGWVYTSGILKDCSNNPNTTWNTSYVCAVRRNETISNFGGPFGIMSQYIPTDDGKSVIFDNPDDQIKLKYISILSKQAKDLYNIDVKEHPALGTYQNNDELPINWTVTPSQWEKLQSGIKLDVGRPAAGSAIVKYFFTTGVLESMKENGTNSTGAVLRVKNALNISSGSVDGEGFFKALQDWLGYGPDLTIFNNNMDMGQLLKDQGQPNYPESGQLQVYYPVSTGNKYAQGLLSGTSTVNITSSGFDTAVDSGMQTLNKASSGASSAIANLLDLKGWVNQTNGNQAASVDWGPFVRAVLAAAAPKLDSGSSQMYVPGSGFYQTDSNGFLINANANNPQHIWPFGKNKQYAEAIMGSGAVITHTSGAKQNVGWFITPPRNSQSGPIPLGIPQCGPGFHTSDDMQHNTGGVTTGVIEPFNGCDILKNNIKNEFIRKTRNIVNGNGKFTFEPLTSFFGSDSDVSWWNVGRSYLVLNQQLAANVQALVNRINDLLSGAKISTALNKVMQPFTSGGFRVTQSQKLKYDIQMSGGIQGTLHLTYRPASEVIPGMQSAGSEGSLTQPLSKNFLMLAVQNKDFVTTGTANNDNKLPSSNGLDADPLVNHLNSLPDNLLKPFEYLALYYRIENNGSNYNRPLKSGVQKSMLKHMNDMVAALKNNGLISDDAAKSSDTQAKMFSSIGSALSSVYEHITPDQIGGGSLTYINPLQIENVLQRLYSFGGASGASGSASGMVGKQYDFLTQIQQIGTTMIGDVVGNLYDIGDTYTATFNNNMALIDGNMTDVNNQYEQIKQATDAQKKKFTAPIADPGFNSLSSSAEVASIAAVGTAAVTGGLAYAFVPSGASSEAAGVGAGFWRGRGGIATMTAAAFGLQAFNTTLKVEQAQNQVKAANYSQTMSEHNLGLLGAQLDNQNSMITMQEKMIDMQKMSYQMSVNLIRAMMMLPLAFVVLTMMFTAGIQFALVIPMTPYIIFWAGQTSWVLNSIEAMVAAPLLGFALLLPGGHGQFGHSIPAVKMLLNVVLKPVLMVFGTIASMVLIYIVVVYSAQGFHMMGDSIVGTFFGFNYGTGADGALKDYDKVTNVRAVLSLMLVFMYATFLTMVFNKCFSAIYLIPEKVVQWLGGQSDSFGKEEAQQMSQATQQQAGQVAQAGQQATQNVAGGAKEMTGAKSQEAGQVEGSDMQMAQTQNAKLGTAQGENSSTEQGIKAQEQSASGSISETSSISDGVMQGASMGMGGAKFAKDMNKT
jgi:hypothetical protein